jgi:hypothetical protein
MKRGLILTESEKNRISNLYKVNLFEQSTPPPPTTPDEIGKFQIWMDKKFPKGWAQSIKDPKSKYAVRSRPEYGFQKFRAQTKKAWDTYGKTYTDETNSNKGNNGNNTVASNDEYVYWTNGTKSSVMKLNDISDLISKGTITKETYITKKPVGGKWEDTKKASEFSEFDFGPQAPVTPVTPVPPPNPDVDVKSDTDDISATNPLNTLKFPNEKVDLDPSAHTFSMESFNNWYKKVFGTDQPAKPDLNPKKQIATITTNNKKFIFTFDDGNWSMSSEQDVKYIPSKTNYTPSDDATTTTVTQDDATTTTTTVTQ